MYPGVHAVERADQAAIVMAGSGETVTYRELEARSNRLAHLLRAEGLKRLDHYALFLENHVRFVECCVAGERSGLYYTCVNSYLTPSELAYIVNNSRSQALITSRSKRDVALAALAECPNVKLVLIVDGPSESDTILNLDEATAKFPSTPIDDEALGAGDALFLGNDRQAQGSIATPAGTAAFAAVAALQLSHQALAIHRRIDLSLARAALSLGAARRRQSDDPYGWDGRRHGAFRRRAISAIDRETSRDP